MTADSSEGAGYRFESSVPSDLSESDMMRCVEIVGNGGAVTKENAKRGLTRASALVVVRKDGDIIAVGAIKRALPSYVAGIRRKAGYAIADGAQELGYVSVAPPHRGQHLSSRIVRTLKEIKDGPLFGTTDDARMKSVLTKAGFQRKGGKWKGERGDLSLWVTD
jgi:GNAT superfamily N-acetyltransferase